jgi:hemolysin activation/secretion protein
MSPPEDRPLPANLDISEKMELGGAYAVRAYPEATPTATKATC